MDLIIILSVYGAYSKEEWRKVLKRCAESEDWMVHLLKQGRPCFQKTLEKHKPYWKDKANECWTIQGQSNSYQREKKT